MSSDANDCGTSGRSWKSTARFTGTILWHGIQSKVALVDFSTSNNALILINTYIDHFSAIKSIDKADESLKNIHELLKSSIFLKQQLKCDEARRRPNTANNQGSSVYKRLSGNLFAAKNHLIKKLINNFFPSNSSSHTNNPWPAWAGFLWCYSRNDIKNGKYDVNK